MPDIKNNIVIVGLVLQGWAEMETNLGIINVKHKGTRIKFRRSYKYGIYYLHALRIKHKPGIKAMIYEIIDNKKVNYTE